MTSAIISRASRPVTGVPAPPSSATRMGCCMEETSVLQGRCVPSKLETSTSSATIDGEAPRVPKGTGVRNNFGTSADPFQVWLIPEGQGLRSPSIPLAPKRYPAGQVSFSNLVAVGQQTRQSSGASGIVQSGGRRRGADPERRPPTQSVSAPRTTLDTPLDPATYSECEYALLDDGPVRARTVGSAGSVAVRAYEGDDRPDRRPDARRDPYPGPGSGRQGCRVHPASHRLLLGVLARAGLTGIVVALVGPTVMPSAAEAARTRKCGPAEVDFARGAGYAYEIRATRVSCHGAQRVARSCLRDHLRGGWSYMWNENQREDMRDRGRLVVRRGRATVSFLVAGSGGCDGEGS
jgi:hypothetical protein